MSSRVESAKYRSEPIIAWYYFVSLGLSAVDVKYSSKSGLGGKGVGFVRASYIFVCSNSAVIGAGCDMCILLSVDLAIIQLRYVVGKTSCFVLYLLFNILFNLSISSLFEVATRKSPEVTAAIVNDPVMPNFEKKQGSCSERV